MQLRGQGEGRAARGVEESETPVVAPPLQLDLSLSPEDVAAQLGAYVDSCISGLRNIGERLLQQLQQVASAKESLPVPQMMNADRVLVLDFEAPDTYSPARAVHLGIEGYSSARIELASPIEKGSYRALILINRR
jgi:hypothetical protein